MNREQHISRQWLVAHSATERALAAKLVTFLRRQLAQILEQLGPLDGLALTMLEVVFRIEDEHQRFMQAISPHLSRAMFRGFQFQTELTREHEQKSIADLLAPLPAVNVPGIVNQFHQLVRQDYWRDIQRGTKRKLSEIIANGVAQGHPTPKIANAIKAALGTKASKARALAIARTETTGALNAGRYEALKPLIEQGIFTGRERATVGDDDVRDTHVAMSGKKAEGLAPFIVPSPAGGTEETPYPGWYGLSAGNRVNCRCTSLSVFSKQLPTMRQNHSRRRRLS